MVKERPNLASFHAMITGIVQGVYFRAYVEHHAQALGLTGYVRNVTHSGAVEIEAEGEKANLEQCLRCGQSLPCRQLMEAFAAPSARLFKMAAR